MLPSLCPVMAAIPSVSRFLRGAEGRTRRAAVATRQRLILGFHAASWQHRYLDCGTLFLSGRYGRGTPCRERRQVAARKEPPVAGACTVSGVLG
jgi:hypothetical protein